MNKEALELFKSNYNNKGDCEGIEDYLKEFKKGTTISYLPWAVVERIFHWQEGTIEVVDWNMAIETTNLIQEANENGELIKVEKTSKALFIHLRGTWMGTTLDEIYPIIDNSNKSVNNPNNMHYNNAKQRGMVKLIARLAGIGLRLFEKGDLQFEETTKGESNIPNMTPPKKTTTPKKKATPIVVEEVVETKEEEVETMAMFLGEEPKEEVVETPKETPKEVVKETFSNESEEYNDLKLKIIGWKNAKTPEIKDFIVSKGKQALQQLTYEELEELLEILEG